MNNQSINLDLINVEFTDGIRQYKVLEYMEQFNKYRLQNFTENRVSELMTKEQIKQYLDNQEHYNTRYQRKLERQKEYEIEEARKEEKERQLQEKYNFCYNYTDSKTDLQRGKILKVLNEEILYSGKILTRKDLIHMLINPNSTIEQYLNTNRWSKKKIDGEKKKLVDKMEYRFFFNNEDRIFLDVTKTEYEYIKYLLNNIIK